MVKISLNKTQLKWLSNELLHVVIDSNAYDEETMKRATAVLNKRGVYG